MAYGSIKVDTIVFTNNSADQSVSISGIIASTSGNLTVTGTISGSTVQATYGTFTNLTGVTTNGTTANFATVSGTTVTGTTANFVTVSGTTVTGTTAQFTSITGGTAGFTTVTGTTVTGTTANFVTLSGTTVTGTTANFVTVSGTTTTGTTANFVSGVFSTQVSGATIIAPTGTFTSLTGTTTTGTTANFVSGVFTTQVSGLLITGPTVSATTGNFTSLTGTTTTMTSGVFALGTEPLPSISFASDPNTGIFSPGADQLAISTNGTSRLHITSAGLVGIGTTSPQTRLHVKTATDENLYVGSLGGSGAGVFLASVNDSASANQPLQIGSASVINFAINGTDAAKIDSSRRLLVGTSTARSNLFNGGSASTPIFQFESNTNSWSNGLSVVNYSGSGYGPTISLGLSVSNTPGTNSLTTANEICGRIQFLGNDATNFLPIATIDGLVDGTPGANNMPGRLVFSTTAASGSSPTEAMRIDNQRNVTIGTTSTNIGGTGFANQTKRLLVGNPTGVSGGIGALGFTSALSGTVSFVVGNNGALRVTIYSTANSASARIGQYIFVGLNKGAGSNPVVQSTETNSPNWTFSYSNNSGDTLVTVTAPASESNFQGMRVIVEPLGS